jgi:hypothetical protein
LGILDLLPSAGCQNPLHEIINDSAGNYQLTDEESTRNYQLIVKESTGRMVFPPVLSAQGREIHPRNSIPPAITSSKKLIQTGNIKMSENSSKR